MRAIVKGLLATALAGLLATPAGAGKDGQTATGPLASVYRPPLFTNPDVQRALAITPAQLDRLSRATNRLRSAFEDTLGRLGGLGERERRSRRDTLVRAYGSELVRATAAILDGQQMSRYRQLEFQSLGPDAFNDPAVAARLNLSEEQRQKLRDLGSRRDREMQDLRSIAERDRAAALRRYDLLGGEALRRLEEILTGGQRRAWRDMIGPPFDFRPDFGGA
jgi:hypothetical protein